MSIYKPKGRAAEYSPLALNVYLGCSHQCSYCYVQGMQGRVQSPEMTPKKDVLKKTKSFLKKTEVTEQVLLSFLSDPYGIKEKEMELTRQILFLFLMHRVPTAILTKAGGLPLRDLDILSKMGSLVKVGATLTFDNASQSKAWEPGAGTPEERLTMLRCMKEAGITTWASFEPVIDPMQSLTLLRRAAPFVDHVKIGRWNHDSRASQLDWTQFGESAIAICRKMKIPFYMKKDLRAYVSPELLQAHEIDPSLLCVKRAA